MKTLSTRLLAIISLLFSFTSFAGVETSTDENKVILAGYDAVAYFTESKAVKGSAQITTVYQNTIYRFSSVKHRDMFNANPEKYQPMYGGYCAYGMTFGKKFEVNGEAFEIVDGRLYVNKDLNVYKAWKEDVPKHIIEANQEWPKVKSISADKL